MEKKQKLSIAITYLLIGAAILLLAYSLLTYKKMPSYGTYVIATVTNLLALICGLIYTVKGSTKSAAMWLKCFEGFAGLSMLATVARATSVKGSSIAIVLTTLSFGLLCVLCYAENLGKKRSIGLAVILTVIAAINFILSLSNRITVPKVVNQSSQLIIILILVMLISHKYYDKEKRGTK